MSELTIMRRFGIDAKTVFAFITRTEHLLKWWGPENMGIPEYKIDFTTTGTWHSVMQSPEGNSYKVSGEVINVDPPNSVEFTWGWHDDNDDRGHESRVRFEVKDDGKGGAIFTLTHSGLADEESRNNHNMGWTSSLRKLEATAG
ncbi:MAG: SRPBCC domain-containing protein [Rhodobacteraceae bacterium]|nr:SRPBCC domain-containing protein [Paracoccaceae bacterium]